MTDKETFLNELWENAAHGTRLEDLGAAYDAGFAAALQATPEAWVCKTGHGNGWRSDRPPEHLMPFWTPLYAHIHG